MSVKNKTLIHPFFYSPVKRALDISIAILLLIGLSPLFIFIGFVVLITAGLPIIFSQKRVGLNGQIFEVYKFRTMKLGAEKNQSKLASKNEAPFPMFKLHQDPRFVGCGRWFSNTGLDELPQLINILSGEMSLIGPRPLPIFEAETIHKLYPSWRIRELVRPGIFSEWSLDPVRHSSLKHWQELDQKTLAAGGLSHEFKLIFANTIRIVLWITKTSIRRFILLLTGKLSAKLS